MSDAMTQVLVPTQEFEEIVRQAVDELPEWVGPLLDEMALWVADVPEEPMAPGHTLLGVYRGFPRTRYGGRPAGSMPDSITLYRLPILSTCRTRDDVPQRVLTVLGHEVGHALGLPEHRLRELGWA